MSDHDPLCEHGRLDYLEAPPGYGKKPPCTCDFIAAVRDAERARIKAGLEALYWWERMDEQRVERIYEVIDDAPPST